MRHFTPDIAIFEEISAVYHSMNLEASTEEKKTGEVEWDAIQIRDLAEEIINSLDNRDKIVDLVADIRLSCDSITANVSS